MCGAPRGHGHTTAAEARQNRVLLSGVFRVGRARLLDDLVGSGQDRLRDGQAEGLRSFRIND